MVNIDKSILKELLSNRFNFVFFSCIDIDVEAEEVLNELNLMTEGEDANITSNKMKMDSDWNQQGNT